MANMERIRGTQVSVSAQTANMVVGPLAANPAKPRKLGQVKQPYLRSPVAAHEPPPVRNMSASALSTSGSLELDASQSAGSFISSQVRHLEDAQEGHSH